MRRSAPKCVTEGGPVFRKAEPGLVGTSCLGTALATQPEALVDLKHIGKTSTNTVYFEQNTQATDD